MTEAQLAAEVVFIVVIRGQVEFQNVKLIQITLNNIFVLFSLTWNIILAKRVEKHVK
jgi:hypothetical protein